MTHAAPQVPCDAGHGGDEGRAWADRARSVDEAPGRLGAGSTRRRASVAGKGGRSVPSGRGFG